MHRRGFIESAALGCTFAALAGCRSSTSTPRDARGPSLRLALLSDTHIPGDRINGHRGFNPWENLRRIVPEVLQAKPEGVILNGDAARLEGLPGDYAELLQLLAPVAAEAPVYIGLGNHDDRKNFGQALTAPSGLRQAVKEKHVLVIEHTVIRIVVLDSLQFVNKAPGLLGKEQRSWLAGFLSTHRDRPVALFVHHTLDDNDGDLLDAPRLFELLRHHHHVKAIFYGHSHVWSRTRREGIHMVNLPAVGYNFRDLDPLGWVDARFHDTGVDLTLRAFAGNAADHGKTHPILWAS